MAYDLEDFINLERIVVSCVSLLLISYTIFGYFYISKFRRDENISEDNIIDDRNLNFVSLKKSVTRTPGRSKTSKQSERNLNSNPNYSGGVSI